MNPVAGDELYVAIVVTTDTKAIPEPMMPITYHQFWATAGRCGGWRCVSATERCRGLAGRGGSGPHRFRGPEKTLGARAGLAAAGGQGGLSADRFDPSAALFAWVQAGGWGYRRRLEGNVLADTGHGDETTTGALAQGVAALDLPEVRRCAQGVMTNLGLLHEAGHPAPWILAMGGPPSRAAVRDDAVCRAIEPMFSDFKERGFDLEGFNFGMRTAWSGGFWSWPWRWTGACASARTTP